MGIKLRYIHYMIKLKFILKNNNLKFFSIFFYKIIVMASSLFPPLVYSYYINDVVVKGNLNGLILVGVSYFVLFIVESLFRILARRYENKLQNKMRFSLKKMLVNVFTGIKYKDYEEHKTSDVRLIIEEDANTTSAYYIKHFTNVIVSFLSVVTMFVIVFKMNFYLALFGLVMIIISFIITRILGEKIRRVAKKHRVDQSDFENVVQEALQNWKEIKLSNLKTKEEEKLFSKWKYLSKLRVKRTRYLYLHGALIAINLLLVIRMNLYFFGGLLVIRDLMTVATLLVFMNYYEKINSNIQVIIDSAVNINLEAPHIDNVLRTLDENEIAPLQTDEIDIIDSGNSRGLVLENVSFRYKSDDKDVIKNISWNVKPNTNVGIIGSSGSGKSTLIKLLSGIYLPDSGGIYLNGVNLSKISSEIRNKKINVVMQDPKLLNMSIKENLVLGKPDAKQDEIDRVCRKVNLLEFIEGLPEKFDTVIGEKGVKLSGGQKQRIAIARTLLVNPDILILDEATSSLDGENENRILESVNCFSDFNSVIIVSHRLSTLSKANQIMVMEEGELRNRATLSLKEESREMIELSRNTIDE